jgi:ATP-dependent DNA ligase
MLERLIRSAKCPRLLYAQHIKAWGIEMFHAVCAKDIEGVVAKRKDGVYAADERWLKIKNPNYSQVEGRRELFESMRPGPQKAKHRAAWDEKTGS